MLVLFNHSFNKYLYALTMPGTGLCGKDTLIYKKHQITVFVELKFSNLFLIKSIIIVTFYKQVLLTLMISFEWWTAVNLEIFYLYNISNQTYLIIVISKVASNSCKIHCSLWSTMCTIFNGLLPKTALPNWEGTCFFLDKRISLMNDNKSYVWTWRKTWLLIL